MKTPERQLNCTQPKKKTTNHNKHHKHVKVFHFDEAKTEHTIKHASEQTGLLLWYMQLYADKYIP